MTSKDERLCDFDDVTTGGFERRWFIRHDIDEAGCVSGAASMIRMALRCGVRPGVFLRVHAETYKLAETKFLVEEFTGEGVVFGLHSECYLSDDWFDSLRTEIDDFESTLGRLPVAINAHGYGDHRLQVRRQFYEGMTPEVLACTGVRLNDCGTGERRYGHTIQDCHLRIEKSHPDSRESSFRYAMSDFRELPPPGWVKTGLVLTHPCYWEARHVE